jgi:hypothetical protein
MIKGAIIIFQRSYLRVSTSCALGRFVCRRGDAISNCSSTAVLTNDAVGEGRSAVTEAADRRDAGPGNSFGQPNHTAFAGHRKVMALPATRPQTALITVSLRESSCVLLQLQEFQTMHTRLNMLVPYGDDASGFTASGTSNRWLTA